MVTTPALDGIRVLDFASVGPGARASRMLSDYGADVVKLGPTPRHGGVQIVPPYYAYSGHRLMRRALLDLKADDGREAFLALAKDADVVLESFRPGVVDRLGIGYDTVRAVNDRIVYCSTSGFGQTGPQSGWAGHDVNYLAISGYLDCTGRRADGSPPLPGATVADIAAGGMHAAMAIMAALLRRERTGTGELLDVSIADGAFGLMSLYVDEYLATGTEPGPGHYILTGKYACYDIYTCADGRHLSVGAIEPAFWRNLCRELDLEQFTELQMDDDRQDEIRTALAAVFATADRDDWTDRLGPADCCVAPVNSVAEAVDHPQYVARRLVVDAEHEVEGRFRQTGPVWAGTTVPDDPYLVRDTTVTDTAALLAEAGYEDATIDELTTSGVIA
jgi:alpha-methylacyl-CoA racemase